jgi:hypothetical protein
VLIPHYLVSPTNLSPEPSVNHLFVKLFWIWSLIILGDTCCTVSDYVGWVSANSLPCFKVGETEAPRGKDTS